jgi:hypothetical protein
LEDVLPSTELSLPEEHARRLDEVSRIEPGFPYDLLTSPAGEMVYGDQLAKIDLPDAAPIVAAR